MRIIKADIVAHFSEKGSRHSLYSIDFQPNGYRLATGGGGKPILFIQLFISYQSHSLLDQIVP
jgi:hypothetical protein